MTGISAELRAEIENISARGKALKRIQLCLMLETPSKRASMVDTVLGRLPPGYREFIHPCEGDTREVIVKKTEVYREVRSEIIDSLPTWSYYWDLGRDQAA